MILPEKSSGISLSCQTLRRSPSCPLFRRSSTCSLCHFHIPTLSDHSSSIPASKKSASHGKLHGDTLSDHNPSVGITQLLQYYEAIRLPVVLLAFSRFAVVCHTCNDKKQQALPSWLNSHNVKHKVLFDPAEANHFSPMRIDLYCFPSKLKRQPSRYQNFETQSHSLFSRCLRLATTITGSHPRLATGGWLDLTRQAFHLLDYSPLSGRTIPIC